MYVVGFLRKETQEIQQPQEPDESVNEIPPQDTILGIANG